MTRDPEDELGRECILPLRHVEEIEKEDYNVNGDLSLERRRGSRIVSREPEDELGRECVLPLRHVEEEEEEEGKVEEEVIPSTAAEDILHMIKL